MPIELPNASALGHELGKSISRTDWLSRIAPPFGCVTCRACKIGSRSIEAGVIA